MPPIITGTPVSEEDLKAATSPNRGLKASGTPVSAADLEENGVLEGKEKNTVPRGLDGAPLDVITEEGPDPIMPPSDTGRSQYTMSDAFTRASNAGFTGWVAREVVSRFGLGTPEAFDNLPLEERQRLTKIAAQQIEREYAELAERDPSTARKIFSELTGGTLGSADPTMLLTFGKTIGQRMLAAAGLSGASDVAEQGFDIEGGIREEFSPIEAAAVTVGGGLLSGAMEGGVKVARGLIPRKAGQTLSEAQALRAQELGYSPEEIEVLAKLSKDELDQVFSEQGLVGNVTDEGVGVDRPVDYKPRTPEEEAVYQEAVRLESEFAGVPADKLDLKDVQNRLIEMGQDPNLVHAPPDVLELDVQADGRVNPADKFRTTPSEDPTKIPANLNDENVGFEEAAAKFTAAKANRNPIDARIAELERLLNDPDTPEALAETLREEYKTLTDAAVYDRLQKEFREGKETSFNRASTTPSEKETIYRDATYSSDPEIRKSGESYYMSKTTIDLAKAGDPEITLAKIDPVIEDLKAVVKEGGLKGKIAEGTLRNMEEARRILLQSADDMAEAEGIARQGMGPKPYADDEKFAGNINLNRLATTEGQDELIRDAMAQVNIPKQGWDETYQKASKIIRDNDIISIIQKDPKLSEATEYSVAVRTILTGAVREANELADTILDATLDNSAARARMAKLELLIAASSEKASGVAGHAGRLLNIFKTTAGQEGEALTTAMKKARESVTGGIDIENFAKLLKEHAGNPEAIEKAAKDAYKRLPEDIITSVRYSMMLSGLSTHLQNIAGTASLFTLETTSQYLAVAAGKLRPGSKDKVLLREANARVAGTIKALFDATTWRNAGQAFKQGSPLDVKSRVDGVEKTLPTAVGFPLQALAAEDQWWRGITENSDFYGMAHRLAFKEGKTGDAAAIRAKELIENPTKEMLEHAKKYSANVQLLDDVSGLTSWMDPIKHRKKNMTGGQRAARFTIMNIAPFSTTADRLVMAGMRYMPGLNFLDRVSRQQIKAGGAERDIALSRLAVGSALIGYFGYKAMNEELTDSGPKGHFSKMRELQTVGWRPQSIKWSEDDTFKSLRGIEPISLIAATVANVTHAYKEGAIDDDMYMSTVVGALGGIVEVMQENTFASSITEFLQALDPTSPLAETNRANFVGGLAGSFYPNAARQANSVFVDPYQRDTTGDRSFGDRVEGRVKSGIFGVSKDLPVRSDNLGRPLMKDQGGGILSTFKGPEEDNSIVNDEIAHLTSTTDKAVTTQPSKNITLPSGETLSLDADAFQEYNSLAQGYVRQTLESIIPTPEWQALSDEEKIKEVRKIQTEMREYAKEDLFYPKTEGAE